MTYDPENGLGPAIDSIIRHALEEDVGAGDVTSIATVEASVSATARFLAKEAGVLSGTDPAARVFEFVNADLRVDWLRRDGDELLKGEIIGRVSGSARAILTGERTALNILQRMSGIATLTARMAGEARPFGVTVLDTRKTAPGIRILDRMAVLHGGGRNHRFGLYDMMLIKDNHIAAAGSIDRALEDARTYRVKSGLAGMKIEIEARTLHEVGEIIAFWETHAVPDRILLDNMARKEPGASFDTTMLSAAVKLIANRIETEASGNVDVTTVAAIAATGVDYISSGALTHSVQALDISLEFSPNPVPAD
ncbi:MAG TPA: carboxylating nicotinate-nucleotide diphosphorylase [Rhodothermales bacterium]|nr:carboxylating nicotinate-nucleotide diphosphorylase [Rhodothermales bacterium]